MESDVRILAFASSFWLFVQNGGGDPCRSSYIMPKNVGVSIFFSVPSFPANNQCLIEHMTELRFGPKT